MEDRIFQKTTTVLCIYFLMFFSSAVMFCQSHHFAQQGRDYAYKVGQGELGFKSTLPT